jgi:hypothetical protein
VLHARDPDRNLRLRHSPERFWPDVKLVEKHILREDAALAQTEELKDGVLLAGQGHRLVIDKDNLGTEIDDQLAYPDRRFGRALETRHDRLNANRVICLELGQVSSP